MSSTPYSREALGHAATLGSALLEAANGWKAATQVLREEGQRKRGDHFVGLHETYLEPLVHPSLLEEARRTAKHGVEVRAHMQEGERVRANPHPSLKGHLDEAAEQIWNDAQKGRVLIVVDRGKDGLRGVVSAPLGKSPKVQPRQNGEQQGKSDLGRHGREQSVHEGGPPSCSPAPPFRIGQVAPLVGLPVPCSPHSALQERHR